MNPSYMPAPPKPQRPAWVLPLVAVLVVLVLAAVAVAVWALRGNTATVLAAPVVTTTVPVKTTPPLPGDAAARQACSMTRGGVSSDDFPLMMRIGDVAGGSSIDDIRIDGHLLHDFAEIASHVPRSNIREYLESWTSVTDALTHLIEACTRNGIKG